ncbi:hypothetical protein, partial [Aeromonas salmonicida]|uniref:hypothetical protein n=1 Tax=Aeromonas salmonicida TaxID=645 RepID=UPI001A8D3879
ADICPYVRKIRPEYIFIEIKMERISNWISPQKQLIALRFFLVTKVVSSRPRPQMQDLKRKLAKVYPER